MLKIFQGQMRSPKYRLVAPPDGKLQTITVKEEVRRDISETGLDISLRMQLDNSDKAIYLRCRPEKCQAHPGEV